MRRITEDELTLRDAAGAVYPPRALARKLTDTIVRSVGVGVLLAAIGFAWDAFH